MDLYLNDLFIPQILEKQLNRRDLDTVCAFELYQMKKEFTTTNCLDLSQFVGNVDPEAVKAELKALAKAPKRDGYYPTDKF